MKNKAAFVLMPFAEEFSDVYQHLIIEALSDAGYDTKRADDIKSQNNILEDVVVGITTSDLIVADLTGSNPNVYYELGIAHALDKNVILLTQEINDLPFDLRSYRVISYNVHFAKMVQAKRELFELAKEAFECKLPFGNPVKDFGGKCFISNETGNTLRVMSIEGTEDELGLLDYRLKLEEGFEQLTDIVGEVGSKLEKEVTPEMISSGEKLNSGEYTTKQQRGIVRELARHMEEYGAFVKPSNEKYREILNELESSLEFLLGGTIELEEGAEEGLQGFLNVLSGIEQSAFEGRQSIVTLIETMEALPKIEKTFNRAKRFMASELRDFVGNIDQTIAVVTRAVRLGKSLMEKAHNKSN